jgi:hypothetical protein
MHGVGFEPTTPVFERAKMVHSLHRAATVVEQRKILVTQNMGLNEKQACMGHG